MRDCPPKREGSITVVCAEKLTPCDDNPNHRVCSARDAEHGEVPDVGVSGNGEEQAARPSSQQFARDEGRARRGDVHISKRADRAHV